MDKQAFMTLLKARGISKEFAPRIDAILKNLTSHAKDISKVKAEIAGVRSGDPRGFIEKMLDHLNPFVSTESRILSKQKHVLPKLEKKLSFLEGLQEAGNAELRGAQAERLAAMAKGLPAPMAVDALGAYGTDQLLNDGKFTDAVLNKLKGASELPKAASIQKEAGKNDFLIQALQAAGLIGLTGAGIGSVFNGASGATQGAATGLGFGGGMAAAAAAPLPKMVKPLAIPLAGLLGGVGGFVGGGKAGERFFPEPPPPPPPGFMDKVKAVLAAGKDKAGEAWDALRDKFASAEMQKQAGPKDLILPLLATGAGGIAGSLFGDDETGGKNGLVTGMGMGLGGLLGSLANRGSAGRTARIIMDRLTQGGSENHKFLTGVLTLLNKPAELVRGAIATPAGVLAGGVVGHNIADQLFDKKPSDA